MALIIAAGETAKLNIQGTSIDLPSIYARINWNAPIHGKSIQYNLVPFIDKNFYKEDKSVLVSFEGGAGYIELSDDDTQSLQFVHEKIKSILESKGFEVTIDLA